MINAFDKDVLRSVTHSLGRFLAIAGIVALGCGFYAGLRMTGPDMRINADEFYDGTHLYDLRVLGSLGFSDETVNLVSQVEGVEAVEPARSADFMVDCNGEQIASRVSTMNTQAAAKSDTSDGIHALSDDDSYLNRPILADGTWPAASDECVVSADRVTNNPVRVGDTVNIEYGTQNVDDVLNVKTFKVVGLVHSSTYVSASAMGTTSLGSGTLQQFLFVQDDAFNNSFPLTEVYVRVAGAADEFSGSSAYQAKVDEVSKRIEENAGKITSLRQKQLKDSAQKELDEKRADYNTSKADAEKQLSEAKAKLDDAAATLASGKKDLEDGQAAYDSGLQKYEEQRQAAQAQIDATAVQLQQSSAQLDEGQAALDAAAPKLQAAWSDYNAQAATLAAGWDSYNQGRAAWQDAVNKLDPTDPYYAVKKAALDEKGQELDATQLQLAAGQQQLDKGNAELRQQQATFDAKSAEITAGRAQVQQGQVALAQAAASAQQQLDAAVEQLNAAAEQLVLGRAQLDEGQREYDSGLEEYNKQEADVTRELADASRKLEDAQAEIDAIEEPELYVLDRTKNQGTESFSSDAGRVDNIAAVFPFIFFLVAALVALTTMTRMVDEDRVLIGTYKALGYSRARITGKYLAYAATASIIGAVLGIVVLSQVLPWVICLAYAIIYNVPQPPLPLAIDVPLALLSAGMGVGLTLIATWAAAAATLHEQPAFLMLPRAPKAGKRILLERLGPLWRRLSFSWKVTCRNIFRYKKRFAMTVIGIGGCTALLLTGLGLSNAINDIIDKQFGGVLRYNTTITLKSDAILQDRDTVESVLNNSGFNLNMAAAAEENHFINSASHENEMHAILVAPENPQDFSVLMHMQNRTTKQEITLDENSVILAEKLAVSLGVGVGDTVSIFDQDDIGNVTGHGHEMTVTDIMENYVGNYMYVGSDAYTRAMGKSPNYRSVFADVQATADERLLLAEELRETDEVDTVAYNDETIDSYRKMLKSVDMIVVVLVVAAAALAFIVLYNLTNINITERRREIASLKVLGFTAREVDLYIFREIALLTLVGAALGLLLGIGMESFVVVSAEVDQVMFGRDIHALSFVLAYVITLFFAAIVMVVMRRKLDHVDMVESLKSVE